jgi:hypothetical protein
VQRERLGDGAIVIVASAAADNQKMCKDTEVVSLKLNCGRMQST